MCWSGVDMVGVVRSGQFLDKDVQSTGFPGGLDGSMRE